MIAVMRVLPKPSRADLMDALADLHLAQAIWFVAPEELASINEPLCASLRRAPGRELATPEATAIWHLLEAELCRDYKTHMLAAK